MRVRDLVQILDQLDQDSLVTVHGYDGGVEEIQDWKSVLIALNVNRGVSEGPHQELFDETHRIAKGPYSVAKALLLMK